MIERDPEQDHEDDVVHGDRQPRRDLRGMRNLHLRDEPHLRARGSPVRVLPRLFPYRLHLRPHRRGLHPQIPGHHLFREGSAVPHLEKYFQVIESLDDLEDYGAISLIVF